MSSGRPAGAGGQADTSGSPPRHVGGGRLSALEAAFLYAESDITPMHVGSLALFDGQPWRDRHDRLRQAALSNRVASAVADVGRLVERPAIPPLGIARPRWVEDSDFRIERHVRFVECDPPGDEAALMNLVARLHMTLLDRRHPLWELVFVDGLADGKVALVEKIHHCLVDGIGGVDVAMMLMDPTPDSRRRVGAPRRARHREPARSSLVADAAREAFAEPLQVARSLASLAAHPRRSAARVSETLDALLSVEGGVIAPSSSLNSPIGRDRAYRVVRSSLPDAHETARRLGGTVNDVALSAVSLGLRGVLHARGDLLADPVHALVPVSIRAGDDHTSLGNQVAALVVPLPLAEADPATVFSAVHASVRSAKQHHQSDLAASLMEGLEHVPEMLLARSSALVHHQPLLNLVVTNVPGPPIPLYLLGSRMLEVFPVVPLARNLTLSVGILSYGSQLSMGLWADKKRFPELHVLASKLDDALVGLRDAAGAAAGAARQAAETNTVP